MAVALLLILLVPAGLAAESWIQTDVEELDSKMVLSCSLNHSSVAVQGHRWTKGDKVLVEDKLPALHTQYEVEKGKGEPHGEYSCFFLPEDIGRANFKLPGLPEIKLVKKSESVAEGEKALLVCKAVSFLPVLTWRWALVNASGNQPITNQSQPDKYVVISDDSHTELHILRAEVERDAGQYICTAENAQGQVSEQVTLRVRHRLAALWPFLGIVAEVLVLVTVIFVYEKRRKPDEVPDDEDLGSAPLKSSAQMNDKDQQVRQRNT